MGNSVTFRLNPKHAEDRAIIEWLDANAGTEGGQTALVKAALLSVIQENNESDYYQKMLKEVQVAISKENEVFAATVKEVMQAMVNHLKHEDVGFVIGEMGVGFLKAVLNQKNNTTEDLRLLVRN